MLKLDILLDKLIKEAEDLSNNNPFISKLIDQAFDKVGKSTTKVIETQNQYLAMLRMLKAWYAREYTGLSPKAVISLIASVIYFVNPIDLIPDFIPFIGKLDDKLVLGYFIKKLNVEIQKFMTWEDSQQ